MVWWKELEGHSSHGEAVYEFPMAAPKEYNKRSGFNNRNAFSQLECKAKVSAWLVPCEGHESTPVS